MIAKVMVHSSNRAETIDKLHQVLTTSKVYGPPTNLEFLGALLLAHKFQSGHTLTNFLDSFAFNPTAVDVISPGVYTTIQDHPGRPSAGGGIPQSGPMVCPYQLSLSYCSVPNLTFCFVQDQLAFQGKF